MDYETLVTMLVATYEGMAHNAQPYILRDEDFRPNPQGEWVKPGGWVRKGPHKEFLGLIYQPFGSSPDTIMMAELGYQLERLEALTPHDMVTTHEQRVVRWARERAGEYMQAQKP